LAVEARSAIPKVMRWVMGNAFPRCRIAELTEVDYGVSEVRGLLK
jgi:hypothetical protein